MTETALTQAEVIAEDLTDHPAQLERYQALGLDRRTAFNLEIHAARIISSMKRSVLEIGRELSGAREAAQYGAWRPFLERCGLTERTAENYMNVWRRFGEKPEIISGFSPTALYALSAPNADPAVVEAIIEEVQAGAPPPPVQAVKERLAPPIPPAPAPAATRPPAPAPAPARPAPPAEAEEIAAVAAPTPLPPLLPPPVASLPPALPGLSPMQAVAAGVETQQLKLHAAKYQLLRASVALLEEQMRTLPTGAPTVVIPEGRAIEAARMFVQGPALGGAAAMLAFSAVIEEAA